MAAGPQARYGKASSDACGEPVREDANAERDVGIASRLLEPVVLDRVVDQLREIERQSGIERTLAIGELILRRFFGGDAAMWQDRRRNKNNSIRRLAARAECPFSKSALSEAVGVYVATLVSPCVRTLGHIGPSHVAVVLSLDTPERERLLNQADQQRWSVRELRENVVRLRRSEGERRGRPSAGDEARAIGLVRTALRGLDQALALVASCESMADEQRREVSFLAEEGGRRCRELAASVQQSAVLSGGRRSRPPLRVLRVSGENGEHLHHG